MGMPSFFFIIANDGPNAADAREAAHHAHAARLDAPPDGIVVRLGGPLLSQADQPSGSAILIEAQDLATARAFAEADPFWTDGIWAELDVIRFDWRRGRP